MINLERIKKEKPFEELLNFSIINVDKPAGCTSFDVVNHIRKSLNLPKCGHFGTLDPQVTGVLPICLGKACRIQDLFMHHDKTYIGTMKLHKTVTKKKLEEEMKKFLGVINQLPPRISRVKRVVRQREIMEFKILKFDADKREVEFISKVEAGTYIRKLIDDLGKNIGGAQMASLRRLKAGLFSSEDKEFTNIEELDKAIEDYKKGEEKNLKALLIPAEIIAELLPSIEVKPEFIDKLKHGSPVFDEMLVNDTKARKIIATKEPFCVFCGDLLIEIAKWSDHFENKSILAKPETVIN
jgi:H/ACA ribonucleoprotein complex subunit 4